VATLDEMDPNAVPFSLFKFAGADLPTVFFSVGDQDDDRELDTIQNLQKNLGVVVPIVCRAQPQCCGGP